MEIKKYIKNGKVAVLYSPGFGAGWSSWASSNYSPEQLMFSYELAKAVDEGASYEEQLALAKKLFPGNYNGGLPLSIEWVNQGDSFYIHEYDGSESFRYSDNLITA